jgi:hypothetical protein
MEFEKQRAAAIQSHRWPEWALTRANDPTAKVQRQDPVTMQQVRCLDCAATPDDVAEFALPCFDPRRRGTL